MNNVVTVTSFLSKVFVKTLQKGKDGSTWYSGDVAEISLCKTGDFCLNPDTFDILKCTAGGSPDTAQWETVCNLDITGEVTAFLDDSKEQLQIIIKQLSDSPAYKPWWFGTRDEYNSLTDVERDAFGLHFIEEGT